MLLAVDIGNTSIAFGIFKGERLFKKFRMPTALSPSRMYKEISEGLGASGIDPGLIKTAAVSSVVPFASNVIKNILRQRFNIKPLFLGREINVPIKNFYKNPGQVGQDRLVNAYACLKLYGFPAIIVDFGTATTFDFLDEKGAYSGGLICPGVEISIEALANKTALLPKIKLKRPKGLIGKDTVESIRSGTVYGLASMCDGIIERIRNESAKEAVTIATGGLARFFAPYCRHIDLIDKDLTLKGIYLSYTCAQNRAKRYNSQALLKK